MQYWQKNRKIDQWNTTESPEIDPHKYSQLIFEQNKMQYNGKKSFQQMVLGQLDILSKLEICINSNSHSIVRVKLRHS